MKHKETILSAEWQAATITAPQSQLPGVDDQGNPKKLGGAPAVASEQATALYSMDKLAVAITPYYEGNKPKPFYQQFLPREKLLLFNNPPYPDGKNEALLEQAQSSGMLHDIVEQGLRKSRAEVIFTHYYVATKIAGDVIQGISRTDYNPQLLPKFHTNTKAKKGTRYEAEHAGVSQAAAIFVSCQDEAGSLMNVHGEGIRQKMIVAPLGIDENILSIRFLTPEQRKNLRERELKQMIVRQRHLNNHDAADTLARATENTVIFYYAGRIVPEKNLYNLVAGYEQFLSQNPDADALLLLDSLPDAKQMTFYSQFMASIEGKNRVATVKNEKGRSFHEVGDLAVLVSKEGYETFSLFANEARGGGIYTKGGAVQETVPYGKFVDPTDQMSIANAMEGAMDPAYRTWAEEQARNIAPQRTNKYNMQVSLAGLVSQKIIPANSYRLPK